MSDKQEKSGTGQEGDAAQLEDVQSQLAEAQQELEALHEENNRMATEMEVSTKEALVPTRESRFAHGFGKYMIPVENTLDSHHGLIYDRSNELDFWPEQFPAFDSLVAQTYLNPAFSLSNHPDYFDYEPLRDNVAAVRNYILQHVLEGVDTSDPQQVENATRTVEQMGREIGVALQRDTLFRRPGSDHLDVLKASEPGVGAAYMYELLVRKQEKNKFLRPVKSLFGFDYSAWKLPPVEQSPFSRQHVEEFCLGNDGLAPQEPDTPQQEPEAPPGVPESTPEEQRAREQADAVVAPAAADNAAQTNARKLSVLGATIAGSAFSLDRVRKLPEPVKERSVELAREILEKLRIGIGDADREQWLTQSADAALAQGSAIASLAELYASTYQAGLAADAALKDDPLVQCGNEAIGKLAYLTKQQAAYALLQEGQRDDAQSLMAELQSYPESWKQVDNVRIGDLLDQIQAGMERSFAAAQRLSLEHGGKMSPQQLQQLLQNGGLSQQDLDTVRHMQAQAASMPVEPTKAAKQHAETIVRSAAPEPVAHQGNYRGAVQSQSREAEFLKR